MATRADTGEEVDEAQAGLLCGHSSEEDGGADIGVSVGLGDGWSLWCGEISRDLWEQAGTEAAELGDDFGHWLILYGPTLGDVKVIGKTIPYAGSEMMISIAASIIKAHRRAVEPTPAMRAAGDAVMAADFIQDEDGHARRPTAADVWKAMAEAGEGKR